LTGRTCSHASLPLYRPPSLHGRRAAEPRQDEMRGGPRLGGDYQFDGITVAIRERWSGPVRLAWGMSPLREWRGLNLCRPSQRRAPLRRQLGHLLHREMFIQTGLTRSTSRRLQRPFVSRTSGHGGADQCAGRPRFTPSKNHDWISQPFLIRGDGPRLVRSGNVSHPIPRRDDPLGGLFADPSTAGDHGLDGSWRAAEPEPGRTKIGFRVQPGRNTGSSPRRGRHHRTEDLHARDVYEAYVTTASRTSSALSFIHYDSFTNPLRAPKNSTTPVLASPPTRTPRWSR
jgi:hypothetical protein